MSGPWPIRTPADARAWAAVFAAKGDTDGAEWWEDYAWCMENQGWMIALAILVPVAGLLVAVCWSVA